MRKAFLIFVMYIVVSPLSGNSQNATTDFPFNTIGFVNSKNGLLGNEVYWVTQDRRGFIWIATDAGLNRYDGYSIKSFEYKSDKSSPFISSQYWGLREDENGILWIPTTNQGLFSFDPYQEKFTYYKNEKNNPNSISDAQLFALESYPQNILWIATTTNGLDKMDTRKKTVTHFNHRENDSTSIDDNFIYCLIPDEKDKDILWLINTNRDVECFNIKTGKVTHRTNYALPDSLCYWPGSAAMSIEGMKNGIFWMGSNDHGIFGFNTSKREYIFIPMRTDCRKSRHIPGMYFVLEDHSGNLWTTNDNNEIVYYDRKQDRFFFYPVEQNSITFIDNPSMLYEDRSGVIWIASTNGLVTVDTKQKKIHSCQSYKNNPQSLSGNNVYAFHRTRKGELLVASDNIQVFDPDLKRFSDFPLVEDGKLLNAYSTFDIFEDDEGTIWFPCDSGIVSHDPVTGKSRMYSEVNSSIKLSPNSRACFEIMTDHNGKYWIGKGATGDLYSYDPVTGKTCEYSENQKTNCTVKANFWGPVLIDQRGILYCFGWERGFITFNPKSETFKVYHHIMNDPSSVSNENCHSFIEAKNGLVWFGTFGGGINVFNPVTEKFRSFTTSDGLSHNIVVSMTEDKEGNYWAGTHHGISCFKPPSDPFAPDCKILFRNYDESDGLPTNTLNKASGFCDADGTMYFGTRGGGIIYFHPHELKDNDFIPSVQITGFRLLNKTVQVNDSSSLLKTSITYTNELKLNYTQNTVSFTFAALNFIHPEDNEYAYMLEGFDGDWIQTDAANRSATYTNLEPGHYVFKVKGSNNDGIWNDNPSTLSILITPPFWKTIWFKTFFTLLIAAAAYAFYRYRIGQLLLLQRIRNKIAADLHDDIGSTLNSISIYSEVAKKDSSRKEFALNMIGESSRKIIDSLSDIVWSINPENDNFDKLILRMRSQAHNLLKAKKIECIFKSDDDLNALKLSMETRRNFYLIFKEALNNLVKYSNATRASVLLTLENHEVTFILRDDGKGFDTNTKYNGNGLINMRKRSEEMNARLTIESSDQGTQVELNFKL